MHLYCFSNSCDIMEVQGGYTVSELRQSYHGVQYICMYIILPIFIGLEHRCRFDIRD
jgi:hypothetical protein